VKKLKDLYIAIQSATTAPGAYVPSQAELEECEFHFRCKYAQVVSSDIGLIERMTLLQLRDSRDGLLKQASTLSRMLRRTTELDPNLMRALPGGADRLMYVVQDQLEALTLAIAQTAEQIDPGQLRNEVRHRLDGEHPFDARDIIGDIATACFRSFLDCDEAILRLLAAYPKSSAVSYKRAQQIKLVIQAALERKVEDYQTRQDAEFVIPNVHSAQHDPLRFSILPMHTDSTDIP
jgi:hypothetical protein